MDERVSLVGRSPRRPGLRHPSRLSRRGIAILPLTSLTLAALVLILAGPAHAYRHRSTTIAFLRGENKVAVVNQHNNSLTILEVRESSKNGLVDVAKKLAEVTVGIEPRCVAVHTERGEAYVTNGVSGTVSVVALEGPRIFRVVAEIPVGTEPRGCALAPNGTRLYVANHTEGTVAVIDPATRAVMDTVQLSRGGNPAVNPQAITITNDGDHDDNDEQVFVTQFFAEPRPNSPGEGFDDGKQAIVHTFPVRNPQHVNRIVLSPIDSGFTADRAPFCQQFNPTAANNTFCPDTTITDATNPIIARDPQMVFPNQLYAAVILRNRLYVANVGGQPEPPLRFNVNVQALVHVVDTRHLTEQQNLHVNLNQQIAMEPLPDPADPSTQLRRLFGNDIVAIDAIRHGNLFMVVSRGGNYALRATLGDDGRLHIGAPDHVVRFQTGNLPNGVVINRDGTRAYTYNETGCSVTAIDLQTNRVIERDIDACDPPEPGTLPHRIAMGRLAYFTALGIPDNGFFDTPIRDIIPVNFRGKASDNAWSGCASCHPDGLTDNNTWSFETGPRSTISMDAFFSKAHISDQRISNWSGVRSSNPDFNQNSRAIQGGCGFASADIAGEDPPDPCTNDNVLTPANPNIYNHGINTGASDALDVQTLWVQTAIRTLLRPLPVDPAAVDRGSIVFAAHCASCHGGQKWTKSQVIYLDNPAFDANPALGGVPRDPNLLATAGQIVSYTDQNATTPEPADTVTVTFLDNVGTFDATDPIEIRGNNGNAPLGALGFNTPSLLGIAYTAPYLHNGRAQNFSEVFTQHLLVDQQSIAGVLDDQQEQDLVAFLDNIDSRTATFRSETDAFLDLVGR